jgi:hypothetical protein
LGRAGDAAEKAKETSFVMLQRLPGASSAAHGNRTAVLPTILASLSDRPAETGY